MISLICVGIRNRPTSASLMRVRGPAYSTAGPRFFIDIVNQYTIYFLLRTTYICGVHSHRKPERSQLSVSPM
jgi:hypothetical protein